MSRLSGLKKDRWVHVGIVFAIIAILTITCLFSTWAKYVTEGSFEDQARVAKWGINVNQDAKFDLFDAIYKGESPYDQSETVHGLDDDGNDTNVVAPGTHKDCTINVLNVDAIPEVMYNFEANLSVEGVDSSTIMALDENNSFYWRFQKPGSAEVREFFKFSELQQAVNDMSQKDIAPNHLPDGFSVGTSNFVTIGWRWLYERDVSGADYRDTYLGNLIADGKLDTFKVTLSFRATQSLEENAIMRFDVNGVGTEPGWQTVKAGTLAKDPETLGWKSPDDYTFYGWYKDNDTFTQPWDFATDVVPSGGVTVYAKFEYSGGGNITGFVRLANFANLATYDNNNEDYDLMNDVTVSYITESNHRYPAVSKSGDESKGLSRGEFRIENVRPGEVGYLAYEHYAFYGEKRVYYEFQPDKPTPDLIYDAEKDTQAVVPIYYKIEDPSSGTLSWNFEFVRSLERDDDTIWGSAFTANEKAGYRFYNWTKDSRVYCEDSYVKPKIKDILDADNRFVVPSTFVANAQYIVTFKVNGRGKLFDNETNVDASFAIAHKGDYVVTTNNQVSDANAPENAPTVSFENADGLATSKFYVIGEDGFTFQGWDENVKQITGPTEFNVYFAKHKSLRDYTLAELQNAANDLATNKEKSSYYEEFCEYEQKGITDNGADNGTPRVEPYHWAIDSAGRTYGQSNFNETAQSTVEFRVIGINKDYTSLDKSSTAGLTLMATHRMPTSQAYGANYIDGGYGTSNLRNAMNTGIPTVLRNAAVPVYKWYGPTYNQKYTNTIHDNFWTISSVEATGTKSPSDLYPYDDEATCQYPELTKRIKHGESGPLQNLHKFHDGTSSSADPQTWWFWTRSMYDQLQGSTGYGLVVDTNTGDSNSIVPLSNDARGAVVPCFCLGQNTTWNITLNSGDEVDSRIDHFTDEQGRTIANPGETVSGLKQGSTFKFKVVLKDEATVGFKPTLKSVAVGNETINPSEDGVYTIPYVNQDYTVVASTKYLRDYTLDEMQTISNDIASHKTDSPYYKEMNVYLDKGTRADGSDNGTTAIEPYHWAVDSAGRTYSEDGFTNNTNTCEFRIIGMNVDNIDAAKTQKAGLTFMATHSMSNTSAYNSRYTTRETWENGGYGHSSCSLRTNMGNNIPSALSNIVVPVHKGYGPTYNKSTLADVTEKFWALSMYEFWGRAFQTDYPYFGEATCAYPKLAELSTNDSSPLRNIGRTHTASATRTYIGLRSMSYQLFNNRGANLVVTNSDGAALTAINFNSTVGVVPCFCLGKGDLSVTLNSKDLPGDNSRIQNFVDEKGNEIAPGTKLSGFEAGETFKFKVNFEDGFRLQYVKINNQIAKAGDDGYYTITINDDVVVDAQTKYFRDYTLDELTAASNDIALNKENSKYYKEFNEYLNKGVTANGSDNGTGNTTGGSEPYHWAIDQNGRTFSEDGFTNNNNTCEFRLIGMNVDNIDEGSSVNKAGLTFMATHKMPTNSVYNSASGSAVYTDGGYGHNNCALRTNVESQVPTALQNAAIPVYKGYGSNYKDSTVKQGNYKVWAISMYESCGWYPEGADTYPYEKEATCAYPPLVQTSENYTPLRNIGRSHLGTGITTQYAWTRSMYEQLSGIRGTGVRINGSDGSYNAVALNTSSAVVPCFCLGKSDLSVSLSTDDINGDYKIEKFTNEDGTIDYPLNSKISGFHSGDTFKFKVVLRNDLGYTPKIQYVKVDGETLTPAPNGVYTVTLGNSDISVSEHSKYLRDYTLEELTAAANDIAQNTTESEYYKEFTYYMNNGVKANGSDNGTGNTTGGSEPYHWAIDANGKTFSEEGFVNNNSTSEFRIIGIGVDNIDEAKTKQAGLTFMATHSLSSTSQYSSSATSTAAYTNGGYGQTNCSLRNTLSNGNGLPRALYDAAVPVCKAYGTTYNSSDLGFVHDKFWAPSVTEVTGLTAEGIAYPYKDEATCVYPTLATGEDAWKPLTGIGKSHLGTTTVAQDMWLRSMYFELTRVLFTNYGNAMCLNSADGEGTYYNRMNTSYSVVPCFCLGE